MAKSLKSQKTNQILYISIGCITAIIVLFIILFNLFDNNKSTEKNNLQLGENNNLQQNNSEEASSSIGNKVGKTAENNEVNDHDTLKVQVSNENANKSEEQNQSENQIVSTNTNEVNNSSSTNSETENNSNVSETNSNNKENTNETTQKQEDPVFSMPVEGEIVKSYGKEKLVYSDTLKEWTTHLGIDIKADKTTVVKASSDGKVKSIKNDPRYGLTVVIEHENGFSSVYSNLLTAEFVVVGEDVKSGQTIGTVGNSATFEILDDPHLHFEILKQGNSVDPEMYIK